MSRRPLPQRRHSVSITFTCRGLVYDATLGHYDNGDLGEIFIRSGKSGTHASIASIETAIAISFGMQYGCPIDAIRDAMPRDAEGRPEGPIGTLLDLLKEEK